MLVARVPNIIRLSQDSKNWELTLRPEVAIRFKQVFQKVSKFKTLNIQLSNTPENCRDLIWFAERFELEWGFGEKDLAQAAADLFDRHRANIAQAIHGGVETREFQMRLPLREYQKEAAEVMLMVTATLLGDDVGLGKTATAIGVASHCLPAMIVCQPTLINQWAREQIPKFIPEARIHVVKIGAIYRLPEADFYVVPYTRLKKWVYELIDRIRIRSVFYDEVQELRHLNTEKYDAAEILASRVAYLFGLSATPIYNGGEEIFNILNILRPGCLGTREEFYREWASGIEGRMVADPVALSYYLREQGLLISRTRKDVKRELPPINRICQVIDAESKPLKDIQKDIAALGNTLLTGGFTQRGVAAREISLLMRRVTGIAKAPAVAEFCRAILERGEKLLVFCWHHEVYAILEKALKEFSPVRFMGEQTATQKVEAKRRFMLPPEDKDSSQLMLMSLRSAPGLDGLQDVCSTCVYAEPDWSPSVHIQCTGRLWRELNIGSGMNQVLEIFLLAEDGSDPAIAELLGLKTAQLNGLMRPDDENQDPNFQQADPNLIKAMLLDYAKRHHISLPHEQRESPCPSTPPDPPT